jgi:hypothetical protein
VGNEGVRDKGIQERTSDFFVGCGGTSARQGAMHLQRTINTPGCVPERRAVDVNQPVTSLVRSCCDAGSAGTHPYRGINIPCTTFPLF